MADASFILQRYKDYYYYYIRGLRVFSRCKDVAKDRNTRGASSMDCRERGSHARGVCPTQYTSRMGISSVKQEEEADTSVMAIE